MASCSREGAPPGPQLHAFPHVVAIETSTPSTFAPLLLSLLSFRAMADGLSASELRQRYLAKPGDNPNAIPDGELSASQLRARYGIRQGGHEGAAAGPKKGGKVFWGFAALALVALAAAAAAAAYYFLVAAKRGA